LALVADESMDVVGSWSPPTPVHPIYVAHPPVPVLGYEPAGVRLFPFRHEALVSKPLRVAETEMIKLGAGKLGEQKRSAEKVGEQKRSAGKPGEGSAVPLVPEIRTPVEEEPFVRSGPGLFPREPYDTAIWWHLCALSELLDCAGVPRSSLSMKGMPTATLLNRTATESRTQQIPDPISPAAGAAIARSAREWVRRWVEAPMAERAADVRAFCEDDAAQVRLFSVLQPMRFGRAQARWKVQQLHLGAVTVTMLLSAEPGVRAWVRRCLDGFHGVGRPREEALRAEQEFREKERAGWQAFAESAESAGAGPAIPASAALRVTSAMDGFQFCPRIVCAGVTRSGHSLLSADGRPKTQTRLNFARFSPAALPTIWHRAERLCPPPEPHRTGRFRTSALPAAHIEVFANLGAYPQDSTQGDVQVCYSAGSDARDVEETLTQLAYRAAAGPPEDMAVRIGLKPGSRTMWECEVTEDALARAIRHAERTDLPAEPFVELSSRLGAACMGRIGAFCTVDPTFSPLWAGPPRRIDLLPGALVALPSNLVHGLQNATGRGLRYHLSARLCFSPSYKDYAATRHPQEHVWKQVWGVTTRWEKVYAGLGGEVAAASLAGGKERRPRAGEVLLRDEALAEQMRDAGFAPTAPRADNVYSRKSMRQVAKNLDPLHKIADDALASKHPTWYRGISRIFRYFLFRHYDTRLFFSAPMQLARCLVLRFPQHYPPETTDLRALATRLVAEQVNFHGPSEVVDMIRTLWEDYTPSDVLHRHKFGLHTRQPWDPAADEDGEGEEDEDDEDEEEDGDEDEDEDDEDDEDEEDEDDDDEVKPPKKTKNMVADRGAMMGLVGRVQEEEEEEQGMVALRRSRSRRAEA
jgi:hypothetical protein